MIEHVINSAVLYRDKRMEGGCAEHLYRVFHLNMIYILRSIRWPPKFDFQVLKKVAAHSGGLENWVLLMYFHKSNIGWLRQPPIETVKKCNLIFYDSTGVFFYFEHQNKVKFDIELSNPTTYWLWKTQWWFSWPQIPMQPHWPQ